MGMGMGMDWEGEGNWGGDMAVVSCRCHKDLKMMKGGKEGSSHRPHHPHAAWRDRDIQSTHAILLVLNRQDDGDRGSPTII